MARLIDADALIAFMRKGWRLFPSSELRHTCDITDVESAPTIDAIPVVRCKDCSRRATVKSFGKEYLYCDAFYDHADGDLIGVSLMVEPDHYCSWGERREDETS